MPYLYTTKTIIGKRNVETTSTVWVLKREHLRVDVSCGFTTAVMQKPPSLRRMSLRRRKLLLESLKCTLPLKEDCTTVAVCSRISFVSNLTHILMHLFRLCFSLLYGVVCCFWLSVVWVPCHHRVRFMIPVQSRFPSICLVCCRIYVKVGAAIEALDTLR